MALHEVIKVRLQSANNFWIEDLKPYQNGLSFDVVYGEDLVSLHLLVFDSREHHEPSLCVVHSKVKDLSFLILVMVDFMDVESAELALNHHYI